MVLGNEIYGQKTEQKYKILVFVSKHNGRPKVTATEKVLVAKFGAKMKCSIRKMYFYYYLVLQNIFYFSKNTKCNTHFFLYHPKKKEQRSIFKVKDEWHLKITFIGLFKVFQISYINLEPIPIHAN